MTGFQTLGVAPPEHPRPAPDSEDFDPADELDRMQRGKESELDRIRKQRKRIDDTVESVNLAEEIIKLEQEERNLSAQLKGNSVSQRDQCQRRGSLSWNLSSQDLAWRLSLNH